MLKAGIITFASAHNYGAILQAYAMQTYLEKQGIETHIINYRPKQIDNVYKIYKIKRTKFLPVKVIRKVKKIAVTNLKYKWKIEKYNNFEDFINNTLNTTEEYKTLKQIQNAYLDYDILIAGSDQIWNTDLTKSFQPAYFLQFGKKEAIRISYAASLGRDELDEKYVLFYRRYLKNFDYITVREKSMIPIIQDLTEKEVIQVVDPTLLLEKKDYDKLKIDSKYKGQKYIYAHFIGKEEKVVEMADYVSKIKGIPVLHNLANPTFENELDYHYGEKIGQIIDMVQNAQMIISNSFHLTILAIMYGKQFITIPHKKRPERMKNLLESLGLEDHLIEDVRIMPDLKDLKIDYKKVKEKLIKDKEKSVKFLEKALFSKKPKCKTNYFTSKDEFECYGCELCADICPVQAITMEEDVEGFVYPKIDEKKCIHCDLCKKSCIYKNNTEKKDKLEKSEVYAIINKDKNVLEKSSSGGVFTALYEKFIKEGGYVVGVKYNEKMEPVYDITNTTEGCEKFRGSKYVRASVNDIRKKVKEKLEQGKKVLFSGNPCQIVALRKYLNKDYKNLYLAEIVCHGVPSPKIFRRYIEYIEEKYNGKVVNFEFRNKKVGWEISKITIKVTLDDGRELFEPARSNNFNRAFLNNYICRPGCYNCEFTGDTKNSDLSMADYWGIKDVMPKLNRDKGISLLKINTAKGKELFEDVKDKFNCYESNYEDAYKANHKHPMNITLKRYKVMEEQDYMDVDQALMKFNQFKNIKVKNTKKRRRNKKAMKKSI